MLAVRYRGVRCEASVPAVIAFVRNCFCRFAIPNQLARVSIETEKPEAIFLTEPRSAARSSSTRGCRRCSIADWNGSCDEELIAPDDRRGMSPAGDGDLPGDVPGVAPFEGHVTPSHSVVVRTSPSRPIVVSSESERTKEEQCGSLHAIEKACDSERWFPFSCAGVSVCGTLF